MKTSLPIVAVEPISISESKRLIDLEKAIERGKKSFVEVGIALAEIRDSRLYRSDYSTFEEYCRSKWNFTRQYVNQIIESSGAVKTLPVHLETIVSNQKQAHELARVEPEKRITVLEQAVSSGPVTAKAIRIAAEHYEPGTESIKPASAEVIESDNESDALYQLKRWWKKTSQKDRAKFIRWTKQSKTFKCKLKSKP